MRGGGWGEGRRGGGGNVWGLYPQPRRPALWVHPIPRSAVRYGQDMGDGDDDVVLLTLVAVGWVQVAGMRNVSFSTGPYLSQPSGM